MEAQRKAKSHQYYMWAEVKPELQASPASQKCVSRLLRKEAHSPTLIATSEPSDLEQVIELPCALVSPSEKRD